MGSKSTDDSARDAPDATTPATSAVASTTSAQDAQQQAAEIRRELAKLAPNQALSQALVILDTSRDTVELATVHQFLRELVDVRELPSVVRIRLSDWFAARGEVSTASRVLEPLVTSGDPSALPALVRLADMAQQRGDSPDQSRLYDEILAIDVGFPGVRERLGRLRAPARAGDAGATLIAPESTQLASGRFELISELGRGGAGAVFVARDLRTRREVALKLYHPGARGDRNARLRAEARVACAQSSRHIVRVFDLIEDLGAVTMEHCTAATLRKSIARGEGGVAQRRAWAAGIAHALAVTHNNGWVHRDLKPGNVLQRADGTAVLTDFGLATRIGAAVEPTEGTAGYTAPEARDVRAADPRADVYAFGALARDLAGDRDDVLLALAERCLSDEPKDRPRDGGALLALLKTMGIS
ncbi:MAG: serine/threonine-protein kinase [Deltaproteobacteria bacterium]|nr:serine/threonine-protein kinase [Deltaproteobacteria bacterium]